MKDFSKPGLNLLILLGYSVLFTALGGRMFGDLVGVHWFIIILHVFILCILGFMGLRKTDERARGKSYFLSMLLVLLIGHGLCFFNGLMNFNMH